MCVCGWPLVITLLIAHVGFAIFARMHMGQLPLKISRWGRQHGPERGGRTVADLIEDGARENSNTPKD